MDAKTFWANVNVGRHEECWHWKGAVIPTSGYGSAHFNGRQHCAHRVAWMLTHGAVPNGLHVMHACDNKLCCNPAHLSAGTPSQNTRDAYDRGLKKRKVHDRQLSEVRALLDAGMRQCDVAQRFGVSQPWVSLFAAGKIRQEG